MNPVAIMVIVTGRPYHLVGVAVEVAAVAEAEVAAEGRMPLLSFQFTRLDGLPNHRIGPSLLLLCGGGMVQRMPKTIALRMQN